MYHLSEVVLVDDSVTRKRRRRWSGRLQPSRGFVWLAPSADCNVTIPVAISSDFHHWLLSPHWLSETHTPIQTRTLSAATRQDLLFKCDLLPFEWFAVSPPLYSWGEPMKTPPTCSHRGNKSASFILIFIILSAALYLLTQFVHCRETRGGGRCDDAVSPPSRKGIYKAPVSSGCSLTYHFLLFIIRVQTMT